MRNLIIFWTSLSISGLLSPCAFSNTEAEPQTPTAPYLMESGESFDLPESRASNRDCLLTGGAVVFLCTTLVVGGVLYASCDDSDRRGCNTIEDIGEVMMITSGSILGATGLFAGGLMAYRASKRR